MALNKITYEDKVSLNPQPSVANKNKVSDADMNEIKAVVNQVVEDTGWVDMSSYLNTTYFSIRTGLPPMVRRIGNTVYWRGAVYCSTAINNKTGIILSTVPSQFLPEKETGSGGVHYNLGTPYKIFISQSEGLRVNEGNNIPATQDYQGYTLSDLGPYLVD